MPSPLLSIRSSCALVVVVLVALVAPGVALGVTKPQPARQPVSALGSVAQLPGSEGCLVDRSKTGTRCTPVRALRGPAPFVGSHALAISPDGRNVYVASSSSQAIAIFTRNAHTGVLRQRPGTAGCIALGGAGGCAQAVGLGVPNSIAVSPDGASVYVAAFTGSAVVVFTRDPSTGVLTQPSDTTGCIVAAPTSGCTTGLALGNPEGVAVSSDGTSVYVAAPGSNAVDTFARNSTTGALTQATDGTGCITGTVLSGCTTGVQLAGADALTVSPDGANVYVTSALSNSLTTFTRSSTGQLTQLTGTSACVINLLAVGCSLGRVLSDPEGLAVSPDGAGVYVTAFKSGALDVFNRNADSGAVTQKPRAPGCLVGKPTPGCLVARGLAGASSVAVSPNGRNVYSAAFASDSVGIFRRVTKAMTR